MKIMSDKERQEIIDRHVDPDDPLYHPVSLVVLAIATFFLLEIGYLLTQYGWL